jgi:hypothetical protein
MKQIVWLNLPAVPEHLEHQLIAWCQQIKIQPEKLEWMNQFHNNQVPIAAQEYGNEHTVIPHNLSQQLIEFYSSYFDGEIVPIVARTKNMLTVPSTTPPHCDRRRYVAVNYLLEPGGANVTTSFYREHRGLQDLSSARNTTYDQVTCLASYVLPRGRWHAFNAQQFHSVENIETERYLFSWLIEKNPTFDEFLQQYQSLITNC